MLVNILQSIYIVKFELPLVIYFSIGCKQWLDPCSILLAWNHDLTNNLLCDGFDLAFQVICIFLRFVSISLSHQIKCQPT